MLMEETCMRKWPNWIGIPRHLCMAELSISTPDTISVSMTKVKNQITRTLREELFLGKRLLC